MTKIVYLTSVRLPSEKAHGVQITHTSEEFSKQLGIKSGLFELVYADRGRTIAQDLFAYYNLSHHFKTTQIKTIHLRNPQKLFFFLQRIQFALKSLWYVMKHYDKNTYIYSRDEFLLFIYSFKFKNLVFEAHAVKVNFFFRHILKYMKGMIVITQGLKDAYKQYMPENRIHVAHDAVDVTKFRGDVDKNASRQRFGLSTDAKIVAYIGSVGLYSWKGVDTFLDASVLLPEYTFLVVGGKEADVAALKTKYTNTNIVFAGHQTPDKIPVYQKMSDVLVIPNKSGFAESELYTSPMKLFEYMASSVPIVSSDLPSLREVLNEGTATFFKPNDQADLATKLRETFADYTKALDKAKAAAIEVEKYTYTERVRAILKHIAI